MSISTSSTNTVYTSAISQLKFPFSLTKDQVEAVEAWIENDFRSTVLYLLFFEEYGKFKRSDTIKILIKDLI
jgi:hypothetical protein